MTEMPYDQKNTLSILVATLYHLAVSRRSVLILSCRIFKCWKSPWSPSSVWSFSGGGAGPGPWWVLLVCVGAGLVPCMYDREWPLLALVGGCGGHWVAAGLLVGWESSVISVKAAMGSWSALTRGLSTTTSGFLFRSCFFWFWQHFVNW